MTNRIITKDRIIGKCEQCTCFYDEAWFGFVPAYCMCEGRILNKYSRQPFKEMPVETYHPIPKWCQLPTEEKKV